MNEEEKNKNFGTQLTIQKRHLSWPKTMFSEIHISDTGVNSTKINDLLMSLKKRITREIHIDASRLLIEYTIWLGNAE